MPVWKINTIWRGQGLSPAWAVVSHTQDYICSGLWMLGWPSLGKYFLGWYCVFRAPGAVFSKQSLSNELKPLNSWFHNELDLDSFWDDLMSTFSFVPVQSTVFVYYGTNFFNGPICLVCNFQLTHSWSQCSGFKSFCSFKHPPPPILTINLNKSSYNYSAKGTKQYIDSNVLFLYP